MKLKHTLPDTPQKEAVIARSRQLTDFKWTPVCDVPTYLTKVGNTVLPKGEEVTGFPYSSTEKNDKFFTENVLIETFLSAIQNPYSKLYQAGRGNFNSCSYGIVCNGLARYALGIKRRVSTVCWPTIPGMRIIAPKYEYTVYDIELCDILYAVKEERSNHVALITDIIKNEKDEIVFIEVSEAVRPKCERVSYSVEEFLEKYKLFALWRYDHLDKVPLLDEYTDELLKNNPYNQTPKISVDNGNKSNYLEGEETIISVMIDGTDNVQIIKNDEIVEEIVVINKAIIAREFERGYYVLKLENSGEYVEFCVNKADISYKIENDEITVFANSNDTESEILYMDFRIPGKVWASLAKYEEITEEERQSGIITRKIPHNGENFKVYFRNKYGVWVHQMTYIEK